MPPTRVSLVSLGHAVPGASKLRSGAKLSFLAHLACCHWVRPTCQCRWNCHKAGPRAAPGRRPLCPLADPFDPWLTVTLDNPTYRWFGLSLMKGKLDWVLLRRLRVLSQAAGNASYRLSDHKWLAADVALC